MKNSDLVKEGYNKIAKTYSAQRDLFKNDKYLAELAKLLKPNSTVLDIGCGSGIPVDKYLIDKGFKVIGIDISDEQIKLARQNIPGATFEVKNMSDLKEGDYQVDAVVSFYAIFHTPREEHPELFKKINSFLSAGGLILVTKGSGEWEGTKEDFHGSKMWWSHYGAEKNKEIVKNTGFEILLNEIDTSGDERHLFILAKKV